MNHADIAALENGAFRPNGNMRIDDLTPYELDDLTYSVDLLYRDPNDIYGDDFSISNPVITIPRGTILYTYKALFSPAMTEAMFLAVTSNAA